VWYRVAGDGRMYVYGVADRLGAACLKMEANLASETCFRVF
jgi:hypothetical protein